MQQELFGSASRQRAREQVSLPLIAIQRLKKRELRCRLKTLGHHAHAKVMRRLTIALTSAAASRRA